MRKLLVLLLISIVGCDSETVVGPAPGPAVEDPRVEPQDTVMTESGLVAFVVVYGDPDVPDSSQIVVAPFDNPASFRVLDTVDQAGAPRFNPSKTLLVYSTTSRHTLKAYDLVSGSIYFVPPPAHGFSQAITWLNDTEYIHTPFFAPSWAAGRFNVETGENSSESRGMLTTGSDLINGKAFVWFRGQDGSITKGFHDPETKEYSPSTVFDQDSANTLIESSRVDVNLKTNLTVAPVLGKWPNFGTKRLRVLNIESLNQRIYYAPSSLHADHPSWISDTDIMYLASDDRSGFTGGEIRVLNPQTGESRLWVSANFFLNATGVAYPEF